MATIITGRKHFNIYKNMESGEGIYYSPYYAKMRFNPELEIVPRENTNNFEQVEILKQLLSDKEEQLNTLKESLKRPNQKPSFSPVIHDILAQSAYDAKTCVDIYKNHYKELDEQIKEKERKKIDDILEKQRGIKERLQKIIALRDVELQERKMNFDRALEYKKHLEYQQKFNETHKYQRKSRSVSPKNYENPEINSYGTNKKSYQFPSTMSKGQISPEIRNINRPVQDFRNYQPYQQPSHTENSPKVIRSLPPIDTRTNIFKRY